MEDLADNATVRLVLSILSATVVFNTFIYKVPQMYDILTTGSSEGLSLTSVVLEFLSYSTMLTYQFAMEFPFETYAENVMMVVQDCLLTLVIMDNRSQIDSSLVFWAVGYVAFFTAIAMRWFSDSIMMLCIALTTPTLCWSKIVQLFRIVSAGDAGVVSGITWFIVVYDTGVRQLTTAIITKDIPMFVNLTSSNVLNVAILSSIVYYRYLRHPRHRHQSGY